MTPAEFDYVRASTVEQAIDFLRTGGGETRLLAGGHSLIPLMKLRLARPRRLVDIRGITGLDTITRNNGTLLIGPNVTHHMLSSSAVVRQLAPLFGEAAAHVGDVQVRNAGTLGGSLAHADPGGDPPAAALALDAVLQVRGPGGIRAVPAQDFFLGLLTTALAPDDMLVRIDVPVPTSRVGSAYLKFDNPASHYALVGVAAWFQLNTDGTIAAARVGVTGLAPSPFRATRTEAALLRQLPTGPVVATAAALVLDGHSDEINSDLHASSEYRAHLAQVLTRRALETARARSEAA
jgi:aerobic carbon-monoxide dehydrogenase medium subunit